MQVRLKCTVTLQQQTTGQPKASFNQWAWTSGAWKHQGKARRGQRHTCEWLSERTEQHEGQGRRWIVVCNMPANESQVRRPPDRREIGTCLGRRRNGSCERNRIRATQQERGIRLQGEVKKRRERRGGDSGANSVQGLERWWGGERRGREQTEPQATWKVQLTGVRCQVSKTPLSLADLLWPLTLMFCRAPALPQVWVKTICFLCSTLPIKTQHLQR